MDGIEQKSVFDWRTFFLILFLFVLVAGLVGGGIYVSQQALRNQTKPLEKPISVSPQPTVSPAVISPTIALADKFDRASVSIQVLNASGVKGAAGKAADHLTSLGYKDVKTGNADISNQQQTIIQLAQEDSALFSTLKTDLATKYQVDSQPGKTTSKTYDVIITVGKNLVN